MKFAVNFSDMLLALLKENPSLLIDYIKVPTEPFPGCLEQYLVGKTFRHLLSHINQPDIIDLLHQDTSKRINLSVLGKILEQSDPVHLSTHVNANINYFPGFTQDHHSYSSELADLIKMRFLESIQIYQDSFSVPLIIENWPYYPFGAEYKIISDPDFISELCVAANCGFLLDLSHARVSAYFFKMDVFKYLDGLPLELTKEIHLSGTARYKGDGFLWNAHTELERLDYQLLDYVLEQAQPEIITLEYGGFRNYQKHLDGSYEILNRNDSRSLIDMIYTLKGRT